jgi:hypothetical protein
MELPSVTVANETCASQNRKGYAEKGLSLKDTWCVLADLRLREIGSYGYGRSMRALTFSNKTGGSVDLVRRLKLHAKLDGHSGCVNSLNFNDSGNHSNPAMYCMSNLVL